MKPISVRFVELFITEAVSLPFRRVLVRLDVLWQKKKIFFWKALSEPNCIAQKMRVVPLAEIYTLVGKLKR